MAPPPPPPGKPPAKTGEGKSTAQAKLIVELPENARLYVDDQLMKSNASRRVFNTPALDQGATYYYILRAEMVVDGDKHTETKQVLLRAGEVIQTSFPELQALVSTRLQANLTP